MLGSTFFDEEIAWLQLFSSDLGNSFLLLAFLGLTCSLVHLSWRKKVWQQSLENNCNQAIFRVGIVEVKIAWNSFFLILLFRSDFQNSCWQDLAWAVFLHIPGGGRAPSILWMAEKIRFCQVSCSYSCHIWSWRYMWASRRKIVSLVICPVLNGWLDSVAFLYLANLKWMWKLVHNTILRSDPVIWAQRFFYI